MNLAGAQHPSRCLSSLINRTLDALMCQHTKRDRLQISRENGGRGGLKERTRERESNLSVKSVHPLTHVTFLHTFSQVVQLLASTPSTKYSTRCGRTLTRGYVPTTPCVHLRVCVVVECGVYLVELLS
jgi:hypothetical protein